MMNLSSMLLALVMSLSAFPLSNGFEVLSGELAFTAEVRFNNEVDEAVSRSLGLAVLDGAKLTYNASYNISPDYKKMDLECSANIADFQDMQLWISMDFSDEENPEYKAIFKQGEQEKYSYMMITPEKMADMPISIGAILKAYSPSSLRETFKSITEGQTLPALEGGKYNISLGQSAVIDIAKKLALKLVNDMATPLVTANYATNGAVSVGVIGGSDGPTTVFVPEAENSQQPSVEDIQKEMEASVNEYFNKLSSVKLFADDAFTAEMVLNEDGAPKAIDCSINVQTNVVDVFEVFGAPAGDITRENGDLDMSIILSLNYDKVNQDIQIEFPELTDENSIDMFGSQTNVISNYTYRQQQPFDENGINITFNGRLLSWDQEPIIVDGTTLVQLELLLGQLGYGCQSETTDGGSYNVTVNGAGLSFDFRIDSDVAYINGEQVTLSVPVRKVEDVTMVPLRIVAESLGLKVDYNEFSEETSGCHIGLYGQVNSSERVSISMPSECDAAWFKALDVAADKYGFNVDIMTMPPESILERTNLVVAAGEPMILVGNYTDEFVKQLADSGALWELSDSLKKFAPRLAENIPEGDVYAIPLADGYNFIIPQAAKNIKEMLSVMEEMYVLLKDGDL